MKIEKVKIFGFSEATLSMIFDNLESQSLFPNIEIINNLRLKSQKDFSNPKFRITISEGLEEFDDYFILGVTRTNVKKKLIETFNSIGAENFINIINKNTDISSTSKVGNGVVINTMSCISAFSELGNFVFVNRNCSIGHHTTIGEFTTINPGVNIAGNVTIGKNCQIGIGACIIDGITIGDNTVIGAGSVVTNNIPSNVVAYGNPCKIIREILN